MARISLVTKDAASDEVRAVFEALEDRFFTVPNLFAAMAHHPPALAPILEYFSAVYEQIDLEKRLLELVIVKVAFGLQSHYCLTIHKAFALERGATDDELRAVREGRYDAFPEAERAVLAYTDAYVEDARGISDETYAALRAHHDEGQVVAISLLISLVLLFGDLANALQLPIDTMLRPIKTP